MVNGSLVTNLRGGIVTLPFPYSGILGPRESVPVAAVAVTGYPPEPIAAASAAATSVPVSAVVTGTVIVVEETFSATAPSAPAVPV